MRIVIPLLIVLITACTADHHSVEACVTGEPAGFWLGLWHGFIAPITFIVSLFVDGIEVYEVNNNGNWYVFGFLLGIGAFTSGGILGGKKAKQ
jgi:hypothetical protein